MARPGAVTAAMVVVKQPPIFLTEHEKTPRTIARNPKAAVGSSNRALRLSCPRFSDRHVVAWLVVGGRRPPAGHVHRDGLSGRGVCGVADGDVLFRVMFALSVVIWCGPAMWAVYTTRGYPLAFNRSLTADDGHRLMATPEVGSPKFCGRAGGVECTPARRPRPCRQRTRSWPCR